MMPPELAPVALLTDDELIDATLDGQPDAFDQLVARHAAGVRAFLLRVSRGDQVLCDDITQEAFLRAFRGLRGFERRSKFSTWVQRIAYYAFLNHRTRTPRHRNLIEGEAGTVATIDHAANPSRTDLRQDMSAAIRSLPEPYRRVIELHFVEHAAYREIAETLQMPLGTVKTQLFRAKALLRQRMRDYDCAVATRA